MYNYDIYGNSPYNYGGGSFNGSSDAFFYNSVNPGLALAGLTFMFIYTIALWVFRSVGLYHMAKERGINHAWFAWVPFLDWYIIGELINRKVVLGTDIVLTHSEFFLPAVMFVTFSVMGTRDATWLSALLGAVMEIYRLSAYWRLFKIYRPQSRVSFTAWTIILGAGFFIFTIRNDKPFDELEPNKVYEDYYGQKSILENAYREARTTIEQERQDDLNTLKAEYEQQVSNDNLTDEERKTIRSDYRQVEHEVREEAEHDLNVARENYNDEVDFLGQEVLEHKNPEVIINDNDVIITPTVPEDEIQTGELFQDEELGTPNEFSPESIHETIEAINKFTLDNKANSEDSEDSQE